MRRLAFLCALAVGIAAAPAAEPQLARFEFTRPKMAVPVKIVLYAPDQATANRAAEAAYARFQTLDGVLSDYGSDSELVHLFPAAGGGRAICVSDDLWKVLWRAQAVAEQSDGAFDITVGPVVRLWRRARRLHEMPSQDKLREAQSLVGYRKLKLDPVGHTVELTKAGMRLDLGGIAKGYAVDEALAALGKQGITRAMIEAGGDIGLGDPPPDRPGWRIGVAALAVNAPPVSFLTLARCSVAISGDTWQYVEIAGHRYSHVIDPRTGVPLMDHCTVTLVGPNGLTTDPLGKVIAVLGPEKGLRLIDATPGASAFILRAPRGKLETYQSSHWTDLHPLLPTAGHPDDKQK
jgi:FAD:protein FMN transferase